MLSMMKTITSVGLIGTAVIALTGCGGPRNSNEAALTAVPVGTAAPLFGATPAPVSEPVARVLSLVAAAPTIKTLPKDLTPALQDAAGDTGTAEADAKGCAIAIADSVARTCTWGDPASTRTVVLLGDSQASMWLPAFEIIAKRLQWKVVLLSKAGCPAVYTSIYDPATKSKFAECDRWHHYTITRINQSNPDMVVVTGAPASTGQGQALSGEVWSSALQKMLGLMTSPNTKKVILGEIPNLARTGPECLAAHEGDIQACSTLASRVTPTAYSQADQDAAARAGVPYIGIVPWFCSYTCTAVIGNMVVYADCCHLTATYTKYLSDALQSVLQPLMDGK